MNPEEKKEEMPDCLLLADAILEAGYSGKPVTGTLNDGREFTVNPAEDDGPNAVSLAGDPIKSAVLGAIKYLDRLKPKS